MTWKSRLAWILLATLVLAVAGLIVATAAGAWFLAPLRLSAHYPWGLLAEEAAQIDGCSECHEPSDLHTCSTCHSDHGDAQLSDVPFGSLLLLTGDVPEPGYIPINDILPYREITRTVMPLPAFLAGHGVDDFESVTFSSSDGGFVTVARENLTAQAMLMPYADGVRFADEGLHVSSWLKGVNRIVVVGPERPLRIDGQDTSIGRLLLGPTHWVTVEQAEVMLKNEEDGQIRRAQTAFRIEGAPIAGLLANPDFATLRVHDEQGQARVLTAEEARGALLAVIHGQVTLVLPGRSRSRWVAGVVEIESTR